MTYVIVGDKKDDGTYQETYPKAKYAQKEQFNKPNNYSQKSSGYDIKGVEVGHAINNAVNMICAGVTFINVDSDLPSGQKIKEYEIEISEDEYLQFETNFFDVNNTNKNLIIDLLDKNNIKHEALKDLLIGELSWKKLINGLYYRLTSVSNLEVDEIIKKNPEITNEQAKNLVIQRQLDLQSSKMLRDMMNEATIEYK